jgi:hypothetical protein
MTAAFMHWSTLPWARLATDYFTNTRLVIDNIHKIGRLFKFKDDCLL